MAHFHLPAEPQSRSAISVPISETGTHRADSDKFDSLLQVERQEQRDGIVVSGIAVQPTGLGSGYRLGYRHGI